MVDNWDGHAFVVKAWLISRVDISWLEYYGWIRWYLHHEGMTLQDKGNYHVTHDFWALRTNQCAEVDARSTRDTITTIGAPAEHARAVGSGGCDHQKDGPHWISWLETWWDHVQLLNTPSRKRADWFGHWFSGERSEWPVHLGCAHQRTARFMITRSMVIEAPARKPFCGVVVDCMWYLLAKG